MANTRDGKRRLSLLDASFLYGESRVSPSHIGSIFMLDGEVPFERVLTHIRQRLHISLRFRQRLVFSAFHNQHITFSMMSDERMMPDPELMHASVEESFEELRAQVPSELLHQEAAHAARAEAA